MCKNDKIKVLDFTIVTGLEQPRLCKFLNNKKAAVSFTFDDSKYDANIFYNSEFIKYNLRGTSMMIYNGLYINQDWNGLINQGYIDVGNHSMAHEIYYNSPDVTDTMLQTDIQGAYAALANKFPNQKIVTFAAPWGQTTTASTNVIKQSHYAARMAGGETLASTNPTEDQWYSLPAFTVKNTLTANQMNAWIDSALSSEGWAIEMMHGAIEDNGTSTSSYDVKKSIYDAHFQYVASKSSDVWCGTFNEVVRYIRERQNANVQQLWANINTVGLSLTDTLTDSRFDFPLTIKVNIPDGWNNITVSQNSVLSSAKAFVENGKNYACINAVPNKGDIVLTKVN